MWQNENTPLNPLNALGKQQLLSIRTRKDTKMKQALNMHLRMFYATRVIDMYMHLQAFIG